MGFFLPQTYDMVSYNLIMQLYVDNTEQYKDIKYHDWLL